MTDGFNTLIRGTVGDYPQSLAQFVQPLVMSAVDQHGIPVQALQTAAGVIDRQVILILPLIAVYMGSGQILNNAAAKAHIDDLHSLTDAENGQTVLDPVFQGLELQDIQLRVDGAGAMVPLSEKCRGDIAAAGKKQPLAGGQITDGETGQVRSMVPV